VSDHCLDFRAKQQNLEERQADVEYELRCLLNKPGMKQHKTVIIYLLTLSCEQTLPLSLNNCIIYAAYVSDRERMDGRRQRQGKAIDGRTCHYN